jgi:hypothetical protein
MGKQAFEVVDGCHRDETRSANPTILQRMVADRSATLCLDDTVAPITQA